MWYAIDFGTSNSLISFVMEDQNPILLELEENQTILRSVIFSSEQDLFYYGREAIEQFQVASGEGRLFRSLKKFLPEPSFKGTDVFGRHMKIEELVALFLSEIKKRADQQCGYDVTNVVLGRPALYSLDPIKDQLAEDRMKKAAKLAGFKRVEFCPEPVAAGLNSNSANEEKCVLVCDFGGGTSDFTLLKIGASQFKKEDVLGLSGVFVAGDSIDGRIMRDFVSSHFGKDITYRIAGGSNLLNFPRNILTKLCNPAHINFLKERETWEFLKELELWAQSDEDKRIFEQLFCLVEENLGYSLYSKIEESKIHLGNNNESVLKFRQSQISIDMIIERFRFEAAIQREIEQIFSALENVFEQSNTSKCEVSFVYLTGGTSQMPLIKNKLEGIFGREKIVQAEAFQSVAQGLGQYARNIMIQEKST